MYRFLDRPLAELDGACRLLVWAMRTWVSAAHRGRCACSRLRPGFAAAGLEPALRDFAFAMHLLNREGSGQLRFHPPERDQVGDDEAQLLALFAAAIGGAPELERMAAQLVRAPYALALQRSLEELAAALWNAPVRGDFPINWTRDSFS
jgi:hypothetical protein